MTPDGQAELEARGAAAGLAWMLAACTFVASYAVQRLVAKLTSEPDWTQITNPAHIPYYWRCGLALLQATIVVSLVRAGVTDTGALRVLRWATVCVPLVVVPMAVAMMLVP